MKHLSNLNQLPDFEEGLQLLRTPEPPYYVVISTKIEHPNIDSDYSETMELMKKYAADLPGYLGMEFAKEIQPDGRVFGLSAVYWKTLEDLDAWRKDMRHMQAKQKGKSTWYDEHNIKVCHVLSQYGSNLTQGRSKTLAYKDNALSHRGGASS